MQVESESDIVDQALAHVMQALQQDQGSVGRAQLATIVPQSPAQQRLHQLLQGLALLEDHQLVEGLERVLPALAAAHDLLQHRDLAWAYGLTGFMLGFAGDPERGLAYVGKALALNPEADAVRSRLYHWQGSLHGMAGRFGEAQTCLEAAVALAQALGHGKFVARSHSSLALARLQRAEGCERDGDGLAMTEHAQAGLAYAEHGLGLLQAWPDEAMLRSYLLRQQAQALALLGRADEAEAALRSDPCTQPRLPVRVARLCTAARIQRQRADTDGARALLEQAIAIATAHGDSFDLDAPMRESIDVEAEAGHWQAALLCARRHARHLEQTYRRRLQAVARHAEVVAEAERASLQAARLELANQALQTSEQHWQDQALRDGLTGLGNRAAMNRAAERLWAAQQDFGTAIVDVDHFKQVNDRLGHAMGDTVLRELGRLLLQACRHGDVVARMGGEEFVLLLPQLGLDEALRACERLREQVQAHDWAALHPELRLTISLGLAMRSALPSWQAQLEAADQALYRAKHEGRNRVRQA